MTAPNDLYSTKLAAIKSAKTLCDIARPLIQAKAKRLVGKQGFVPDDKDEIEQEAMVRLLDRFASEKARGLPVLAFIQRVVNQSISNQVRAKIAKQRDRQLVRSLHGPSSDSPDSTQLVQSISESSLKAHLGRLSREAEELVDLGIDIEEALAECSREQRELCEALQIDSISELSRRLQVPRTTLNEKVHKLRGAFERRGLKEYVEQKYKRRPST